MLSEHKLEVLRAVEASELPVREVLDQLEIPRSTYYRWRSQFRKEGVGRTPGPPPGIETGLESDPAPRTAPNPGDRLVVSREVPTGGELPGDGLLRVYGFGILGLPDSEGRRSDPGGSTSELPCRIGVSDSDHRDQPAVANGCDLSSGQELGLVLSDLGTG